MSAQAGIWNLDGRPVERNALRRLSDALEGYCPDGVSEWLTGAVGMLYCAVHTTLESRLEHQPHVSSRGVIITWDGRLDNRDELIAQLDVHQKIPKPETDVAIVGAAFDYWGATCFAKIIGDWALSAWDPLEKTLILAKDYMGIRHLNYSLGSKVVIWCKYLRPIVSVTDVPLSINEEYVAGFMASYPRTPLTPYSGIYSVPPGSFVSIQGGRATVCQYAHFDPERRIHYRTDAEYEEHFRHVFRQAVKRRLRSDSPILAELSGGIDSSSIVCMADDILAKGEIKAPSLHTISHYASNDSGGDEREYFSKIEGLRGREGHHFDRNLYQNFFCLDYHDLILVPGHSSRIDGVRAALSDLLQSCAYRVVLSGVGGDEFLGGVPNPYPQLADLIVLLKPIKLAQALQTWSLRKKLPWIQVLYQSLLLLFPRSIRALLSDETRIAPWIQMDFAHRHQLRALQLGPQEGFGFWLPSRREFAQSIEAMRQQLAFFPPHGIAFEERRYPYLDQNLVEFLLSIPSSQLLRPGQRRSLMRRALVGLVPAEILLRKNKGTVSRGVLAGFADAWPELEQLFDSPIGAKMGYINLHRVQESLQAAKHGDAVQLLRLVRTIYLELWLRSLSEHGLVNVGSQTYSTPQATLTQQEA